MRKSSDVIVKELEADRELLMIYLQDALSDLFHADSAERKAALLALRNVVNAGIGFKTLEIKTGITDKNLMRTLNGQHNPTMEKLFAIIQAIFEYERVVYKGVIQEAV